jgi:hypothetical protein
MYGRACFEGGSRAEVLALTTNKRNCDIAIALSFQILFTSGPDPGAVGTLKWAPDPCGYLGA